MDQQQDRETMILIRALVRTLSVVSQYQLAQELNDLLPPFAAGKRFGTAAHSVIQFLDGREELTIKELIKSRPNASKKAIYNAVGYLARRGILIYDSYGKYKVRK